MFEGRVYEWGANITNGTYYINQPIEKTCYLLEQEVFGSAILFTIVNIVAIFLTVVYWDKLRQDSEAWIIFLTFFSLDLIFIWRFVLGGLLQ